ncbi:MAG: hypothetical protein HFH31_02560 [Bacilli bacterium]|nr:hypothetical protein [Bacilli bacterium]
MDFKNQNMFGNRGFNEQVRLNQNPVLHNTVANLKAMSTDPTKKNQVLSTLGRFSNQMNPNDYNEILANVKSVDGKKPLGAENKDFSESKGITDQSYQQNVSNLKSLEREMRYR